MREHLLSLLSHIGKWRAFQMGSAEFRLQKFRTTLNWHSALCILNLPSKRLDAKADEPPRSSRMSMWTKYSVQLLRSGAGLRAVEFPDTVGPLDQRC
jgi:hypothetical protein